MSYSLLFSFFLFPTFFHPFFHYYFALSPAPLHSLLSISAFWLRGWLIVIPTGSLKDRRKERDQSNKEKETRDSCPNRKTLAPNNLILFLFGGSCCGSVPLVYFYHFIPLSPSLRISFTPASFIFLPFSYSLFIYLHIFSVVLSFFV